MIKKVFKNGSWRWATGSVALVSSSAFAAIDLTPITDAAADVALVGAAVFGVIVAIAAWKFVRRSL